MIKLKPPLRANCFKPPVAFCEAIDVRGSVFRAELRPKIQNFKLFVHLGR
jgi:hypothetical protein